MSGYEVNVPFRGHHEGFAVLLCFAYLHPTRFLDDSYAIDYRPPCEPNRLVIDHWAP